MNDLCTNLAIIPNNARHDDEFVVATDASKFVSMECFSKKTLMDLSDHVLIGLENLKIMKRDIVPTSLRHLPLFMSCLVYGENAYLDVMFFSVVTDHTTLTHFLKQPSDKLIDRQVHPQCMNDRCLFLNACASFAVKDR